MPSKKKRRIERPTIHPRNRYSENVPDFRVLASLYPSFEPYVYYTRGGWPKIDWTDYNATRELTRVLLDHDHNVKWWIPDGQLCPAVPNRSNYIHWIEDLLSSEIVPKFDSCDDNMRGFDIGTGANCIYPLLGASLLGWRFVGSDVTDIAIEWARKNVDCNPHLLDLIEIRRVGDGSELENSVDNTVRNSEETFFSQNTDQSRVDEKTYASLPVLLGIVRDNEKFDFCMCNPPFFETIEEAGLNPETSFGGTHEEMVCPGGERAFITKIIEDSVELKQSFRWYTSMVGRKVNLKFLVSKLRDAGVSIVKTTEFVQGQTSRWGLAWSFAMPKVKIMASHLPEKSHQSFTLEGLPRQLGAVEVLKSVELLFLSAGASCKTNLFAFTVDITASKENCDMFLKDDAEVSGREDRTLCELSREQLPASDELCFRVSVFEQIPGTLLVKGSLLHKQSPLSGLFSSVFYKLEEGLRKKFPGKIVVQSNTWK
ncbi:hypothetical protein H6P81_018456 [Aristolochia fimbriata]|uniref:U6 small nuclear RNA (adenine-(43)-N(6))-methyltransferase n=1 Tax=Aristolochia fimbriata TaxID=158543 RepID=A0AAV7E5A1_ARIFI|nr:hypothetical protein H6P81_018456 [Aristolochia fimbriata]